MTFEEEFREFKQSILMYVSGLKEWQSGTEKYRATLKEYNDKMLEKIDEVNSRCLIRSGVYLQMQSHIDKEDKTKDKKLDLLSSRLFQSCLAIFAPVVVTLITLYITGKIK